MQTLPTNRSSSWPATPIAIISWRSRSKPLGALDEADQIAAIDGVDLLFVGPADLSQALGVLGQPDHEKVWAAIDRVAEACRRHGKAWGIVPASPAYADRCAEKGCRMITFGSDVAALRLGMQALKTMYASQYNPADERLTYRTTSIRERRASRCLPNGASSSANSVLAGGARAKKASTARASHCLPAPSFKIASTFSSGMPLR